MTKEEITTLIENVKRVAILADELSDLADNYTSLAKNGSYLSIGNTANVWDDFIHPDWMNRPSWCGTFEFPHRGYPRAEVRNEAIGTNIKEDVAEIIIQKIKEGWDSMSEIFSQMNAVETQEEENG